MKNFFKQTILSTTLLIFLFGCGVMSKPEEEKESIHVPQNIFIEMPKVLKTEKKESNKTKNYKMSRWYK